MPGNESREVRGSLAARINECFEVMRAPNAPVLSHAAAAAAITAHTGVPISPVYLWQLRKGIKTNPTLTHLKAIAQFFGVPPMYLIDHDHDADLDSELVLLQALRESGVRGVMARVSGLSPATVHAVAALLDHLRDLEGLPPAGEPPIGGPVNNSD